MRTFQRQIDSPPRLAVAGLTLLAAFAAQPAFADAQTLREMYASQRDELANNAFQAPIHLASSVTDTLARGEVFAVIATPFDAMRTALNEPAGWCELAILHVNIKACTYSVAPDAHIELYVGHKEYETPDQAYALQYRFQIVRSTAEDLAISLTAPIGPLGTSNYDMELEAIPLDATHSFLHFSYAYNYNWVSRLALDTYLATLGRDKVGFTVTGRDDNGQPVYIKGIQGIVERNSMRYFLAIQATMDSLNVSPLDKVATRFKQWYELIQRYPRQLVDYTLAQYLDRKRLEYRNQTQLQQGEKKQP